MQSLIRSKSAGVTGGGGTAGSVLVGTFFTSVKLLIICFKCHLIKAQQSQLEGDSPATICTTIFPLGAVRSPGKFSFQKMQPSILPGSR